MLTYKRIQDTVSIAKSPTMLNTTDVEGAEVRGGKGRREREREGIKHTNAHAETGGCGTYRQGDRDRDRKEVS